MKINTYKLKPEVTIEQLKVLGFREGGKWINPDCEYFKTIRLKDSISLNIGMPSEMQAFCDFENILVMDEDFGQPYAPFYTATIYKTRSKNFTFLLAVIREYNKTMDELGIFVKEET